MTQDTTKRVVHQVRLKAALDAFRNEITGVGTSRSKLYYGEYTPEPLLDTPLLAALYKDNDLARKIIQRPVDDALREGFGVKRENAKPETDREDAAKIVAALKALCRDRLGGDKVKRAASAARCFGGGGLLLGAEGAGGLSSPLNEAKVKALPYILDWDRRDMVAVEWYPDGTPSRYRYTQPGRKTGSPDTIVHESRLIFFPGAHTHGRERAENQDWDHSVLQAVYQTLKSFDQMFSSVDAMFSDASQAIFKLQGLIKALAESESEGTQAAVTRLQLMDMMRSATKAIMLDAGTEDGTYPEESYEVVERQTVGQISDTMQQYYVRLACSADMPLTVLLGMAPAGMDATGESDMILYFNKVDAYRRDALEAPLSRLVGLVAQTLGIGGEWSLVWPELARPKPLDVATADNMRVTSLCQLIQNNVVLPEEAALSLGRVAPALGVSLDPEPREEALEEALKQLAEGGAEPVAPVGEDPETGPDEPSVQPPPERKSERKTPAKAAKRQT